MLKFSNILKEQIENKYPLFLEERNKKWVDLLWNAKEKKFIWNVDFKEAKFALSRNFDEIGSVSYHRGERLPGDDFTKSTAKYVGVPEDSIHRAQRELFGGTFQTFQSINKLIHIAELYLGINKGDGKGNKIIEKYLELYKSWKVIKDLFDDVKPFITKGRRLDPTKPPKPIYQPPRQSMNVLGEIRLLLDNLIQKHKEELKTSYINMVTKMTNRFMNERTIETASPGTFFKHSPLSSLIDSLLEFNEERDPWDYKWHKNGRLVKIKYRSDANEKIEKFATQQADDAANAFVINNMKKLTAVIGEKTKNGITVTDKTVNGSFGVSFSGIMKFKFSDNTGFTTRNDITINVSPRGLAFNQFPITFHNVTFKNEKFMKFVSEKTMNEVWAKENE